MLRKGFLIDAGLVLALLAGNLLIIAPYLLTDLSSQAWNNDYDYVAMARLFRDQPWTWNALQYCGTPFRYLYPPLFHVLVAALPVSLGRSYHLVSGLAYALVPVCLYILVLQLFSSRFVAACAGVAFSILASPIYVLPLWRNQTFNFHHAPWGFVTLMQYSEGPHTMSFAFSLLTVAAAWRSRWTLASLGAAAVFLLNWAGFVGVCMVLASVAIARTRDLGRMPAIKRLTAVGGVAYGLSAFWITPGFLHTTTLLNRVILRHSPAAAPWGTTTWLILLGATTLLGLAMWPRTSAVASLVLAWLAISGAPVVAFSLEGSAILPMPFRYVMEFNAGLILALAGLASLGRKWRIAVVAAAFVAGGWAARGFLRNAWSLQPGAANQREMLAFQISDWLKQNAGRSRIFATGEIEGSLNALTVLAQAGGEYHGISNFLVTAAQRQINSGCGERTIAARINELWLRALDVGYVVVHDARSREHFHWYVQPEAFAGFPVAWTNGAGDTIYRTPPPEEHQAVVVDPTELKHLPRLRATDDLEFLEAYVAWARGLRPAEIHWSRPDTAHVEADLGANEAVLIRVNYNSGWRSPGSRVQPDPIGFLLVRPPQGRQRFDLRFGAAWDVWLARAITLLTIVFLLVRAPASTIALSAVVPAALAYGVLLATTPNQITVAEEAFRRLQPPIISGGGIGESLPSRQQTVDGSRRISIYGMNFGSKEDRVRVWVGDREAPILNHASNLLVVQVPEHANASVTVEVNGCRGNSFLLPARDP